MPFVDRTTNLTFSHKVGQLWDVTVYGVHNSTAVNPTSEIFQPGGGPGGDILAYYFLYNMEYGPTYARPIQLSKKVTIAKPTNRNINWLRVNDLGNRYEQRWPPAPEPPKEYWLVLTVVRLPLDETLIREYTVEELRGLRWGLFHTKVWEFTATITINGNAVAPVSFYLGILTFDSSLGQ